MTETSQVKFNIGPYMVSYDTGIVDVYELEEIEPKNIKEFLTISGRRIEIPYSIYAGIISNAAKNNCFYVKLWQYDISMSIDDKRSLHTDSERESYFGQGSWKIKSSPYTIDGMEGVLTEFEPKDKSKLNRMGKCVAKKGEHIVYGGSYWPDESILGPRVREFSVWCTVFCTLPWERGAKTMLDTLKVRNVT